MDSYNLLVIDDDPNIRRLLSELLASRPEFRLLIAADGKEAVRQFAENRIDMVLTDIHMPGFTGLELMADMKKINFKPEILVMTANATPENVETARRLGARSVILKPFDDLEVIEAEINKALRSVKTARARINGDGNGHGLPQPVAAAAVAQAGPEPQARETPAHETPARPAPHAVKTPPAKPASWSAPKKELWPARKSAAPAPEPVVPTGSSDGGALPDFDTWQADLTGNETPPAPSPRPPAEPAPARAAVVPVGSPMPTAPPVPARTEATPQPPPARPAPAARPASPARSPASPPASRPAPTATPAPIAPPAAPAPVQAARPAATPPPDPRHAPPAPSPPTPHETVRPAAHPAHPRPDHTAVHEAPEEAIPEMPADLEAIFRMATSFDTGRMRMQVPIVCLQT